MNKNIITGGVIVVVVGLIITGATLTSSSSTRDSYLPADNTPLSTSTAATGTSTNTTAAGSYSAAEVATHANTQSCWTIVNNNVYDVTTWISEHPGGSQAILGLCGKDGTSAFEGQHAGQGRPETELASFKIGTLAL